MSNLINQPNSFSAPLVLDSDGITDVMETGEGSNLPSPTKSRVTTPAKPPTKSDKYYLVFFADVFVP